MGELSFAIDEGNPFWAPHFAAPPAESSKLKLVAHKLARPKCSQLYCSSLECQLKLCQATLCSFQHTSYTLLGPAGHSQAPKSSSLAPPPSYTHTPSYILGPSCRVWTRSGRQPPSAARHLLPPLADWWRRWRRRKCKRRKCKRRLLVQWQKFELPKWPQTLVVCLRASDSLRGRLLLFGIIFLLGQVGRLASSNWHDCSIRAAG